MKAVLRSALGTLFLIALLVALFSRAVKTKILEEKYWTETIQKSGVYSQVLVSLDDLQRQSDAVTKSKGLPRIIIKDLLSESRLQDLTTTNIQRLLAFLNGKVSEIIVYLPFQEWGFPGVKLAKDTNIVDLLFSGGLTLEQKQPIVAGLEATQLVGKNIGVVNLVFFAVALLLLVGHGFLGDLKGTGVLLLVSGIIVVGAGKLGEGTGWLIAKSPSLPAWGKVLIEQLIRDFFSFGVFVGLGIAGLGVILWWVRRNRAPKEDLITGIVKNILGSILILLIILGLVSVPAFKILSKFNLKQNPKQNWTLNVPKDWKAREEQGTKFFTNTKISISVSALVRGPQMEKTDYLQQVVKNLSGSKYQRVFVGKPYQDEWQNWKRSVFVYDVSDPQSKEKVRSVHWELLPTTGNGYNLVGAARATDWSIYEKQIISILDSFKLK